MFSFPYQNINYCFCLISTATVAVFTSGKYKATVNIWTNLCLVRYRENLGTHPFTASLLHYIGDAYQKLSDPKRAVDFKKDSLDTRYLLGNISLGQSKALLLFVMHVLSLSLPKIQFV